ncbi:glutathione S-transferase family protein [Phreatobacter stygius]|uniref:Glutathione S-transferase family protein n=1 Tax=Phreatobacter stygius TaxID=1940610 RepID=A0A4D7BCK9_9HYPH|nr:glutathione S-transferase family protein [Phreatobacter stygius]QCI65697.1 glutathione S-transferase family protein [Phreatobacter stygius]
MILIGQYDSPFVRRVAIALSLYGLAFEHRPWSVFSDSDEVARYNPLIRVPALILDDGEVLIESAAILDYLDELVGPSRALIAESGPARRHALKICALAAGLGEKAGSLTYERVLHQQISQVWVDRLEMQIRGVLDVLEAKRAIRATPFWFGDTIGHADIAVACVLRGTGEAHPGLFDDQRWPALAGHAARCEALAPFRAIAQPFLPPS